MKNPYLIGTTLYLRPLEPEDAPLLTTWFNDPDMLRNMARYRPMTVAQELQFLQEVSESETCLALGVVVQETDQLIGSAGFKDWDARNRQIVYGIGIGEKSMWNKGYGTETTQLFLQFAFQRMNLNRVYLHVYEFNKGAIRCYKKVGFKIEGRLRQNYFNDGRYWDTIVMGILREEWQPPS